MNVVWSENDQIKVIDATSEPAKEGIYILENGKGGGATATFSHSSGDVIENVTDIVYPATAAEDLSIPAAQTYTAGSYDPVAAVLKYHSEEPVAISSEGFQLENTASIIAISLKGNETVASVSATLTPANGGETLTYTSLPKTACHFLLTQFLSISPFPARMPSTAFPSLSSLPMVPTLS